MILLIIFVSLIITCICLYIYTHYLTMELKIMEQRIDKKIELNNELNK